MSLKKPQSRAFHCHQELSIEGSFNHLIEILIKKIAIEGMENTFFTLSLAKKCYLDFVPLCAPTPRSCRKRQSLFVVKNSGI